MNDNLVTSSLLGIRCLSGFRLIFTCAAISLHPVMLCPELSKPEVLGCLNCINKDNSKHTKLSHVRPQLCNLSPGQGSRGSLVLNNRVLLM